MHAGPESVDVFVERGSLPDKRQLAPCLSLHGAQWQETLLGLDKQRAICRFRAPDAETMRLALHRADIDYDRLWTGRMRRESGSGATNLVVAFHFEHSRNALQADSLFLQTSERLERHGIRTVHSVWSLCQRHGLLLCRTDPDAAIDAAWNELAGPGIDIWRCGEISAASGPPPVARPRRPATPEFAEPLRMPRMLGRARCS